MSTRSLTARAASALLSVSTIGLSQEKEPASPAAFSDGDRWSAVGDSITEAGQYIAWLEYFYRCRTGGRQLTAWNCGIGGDTASGGARRLASEADVTKPTVISVMFGMNDLNRAIFTPGASATVLRQDTTRRLTTYADSITSMADEARKRNVRLIILSPTPFEHGSFLKTPDLPGVNEALNRFSAEAADIARSQGATFVDTYRGFNDLLEEIQSGSPTETLIDPDRVHPNALGQLAIAMIIFHDLRLGTVRQIVALDAAKLEARCENAAVSKLVYEKGRLDFDLRLSAIPVLLPAGPIPAALNARLHAEVARDSISIAGLPKGSYRLLVGGQECGTLSAEDLQKGIDPGAFPLFPPITASQNLKDLIFQKMDRQWEYRQIAWCEFVASESSPGPLTTKDTVAALRDMQIKRPYMQDAIGRRLVNYERLKAKESALLKEIGDLEAEINGLSFPLSLPCSVIPERP